MKTLLLTTLLALGLQASTLGLTGFATSKHNDDGYNEQHKWVGVKYSKRLEESLKLTTELATFKNSYNDRTYIGAIGLSYMPFHYDKFSFGANASVGIQKGYCMDGINPKKCQDGENDIGAIVLPSLEVSYQLDQERDIGFNVLYNEGLMMRFYFDLLEW